MTTPHKPQIGLLPFYLALYDELLPELRAKFDGFIADIVRGFEKRGIAVETTEPCRVASEFEAAIRQIEDSGADSLVTLHLAYSPSLESIDAMCRTDLPIIILDTTMDASFGMDVLPDRLMYNHGIHGVMDLASVLRRRGRAFEIVAGHCSDPSVLDRAAGLVRNPSAMKAPEGVVGAAAPDGPMSRNRILRIGDAFTGMGDFAVEPGILSDRFGITVEQVGLEELDVAVEEITEDAIAAELALDRERFDCELDEAVHRQSIRVGLGLRELLNSDGYHGFSINFQEFDRTDRAADTMPFLEISKAMARGIGYAGEGDVLTAALVGALAREFKAVTFTEIFCPDWTGNSLFLSHMGEISHSVADKRPRVFAKPAFDRKSKTTAVLTCAVKPGPAVFVNLAPGPKNTFSLIVAPVDVLPEGEDLHPKMHDTVRAWIRPGQPIADFLEKYSRAGGTHHSALVLGDRTDAVAMFGERMNVNVVWIR
jgi:L-arabinose isomerase